MTWPDWDRQLLVAIGAPVDKEQLRFLRAWALAEGGHARYNPLNTTMHVPGATDYNSAHVKNYQDSIQGLAATMLTIRLSYYTALVHALRSSPISAEAICKAASRDLDKWGTSGRAVSAVLASH